MDLLETEFSTRTGGWGKKRRKGEWKKKCGTRNGPRPIYDHDSVISPKYWIARGVITGDGHRLKQLAPVLIIWFFSDNCAIIGPIPFTWTSVGLASKIPVWVKCRRRSSLELALVSPDHFIDSRVNSPTLSY